MHGMHAALIWVPCAGFSTRLTTQRIHCHAPLTQLPCSLWAHVPASHFCHGDNQRNHLLVAPPPSYSWSPILPALPPSPSLSPYSACSPTRGCTWLLMNSVSAMSLPTSPRLPSVQRMEPHLPRLRHPDDLTTMVTKASTLADSSHALPLRPPLQCIEPHLLTFLLSPHSPPVPCAVHGAPPAAP